MNPARDPAVQELLDQAETVGMLGTLNLEMSPELSRLLERGLLGEGLPPALKSNKAAQAFQQAFEMIGGVPRLALWADQNTTKFYTLFSKLVPSTTNLNEKKDININITWASSDRLSYQKGVIDADPA
jgi:hypothetical protein